MKKETIKNLLDEIKKESINAQIINRTSLLNKPAINEQLNNMLENIYIELDEKLNKGKLSQSQFNELWDFAQNYCSKIQL